MAERLLAIKGPMFSEKTTALIGQVHRAEHADKRIQVFKPDIDKRWGVLDKIRSHNQVEYPATMVGSSLEILEKLNEGTNFVAIDEIQFFDSDIISVVSTLIERDVEVVFAGLPLDFRGEPFGFVPQLLAMSDEIINQTAVCKYRVNGGEQCNQPATRTQRMVNDKPANYDDPIVVVGAAESYEARCPKHHEVPGRPSKQF